MVQNFGTLGRTKIEIFFIFKYLITPYVDIKNLIAELSLLIIST
jgi:hypothetical protein